MLDLTKGEANKAIVTLRIWFEKHPQEDKKRTICLALTTAQRVILRNGFTFVNYDAILSKIFEELKTTDKEQAGKIQEIAKNLWQPKN